jgi:hypothetical protein
MSSGGFRTTHFKFSTNDKRKHKCPITTATAITYSGC